MIGTIESMSNNEEMNIKTLFFMATLIKTWSKGIQNSMSLIESTSRC